MGLWGDRERGDREHGDHPGGDAHDTELSRRARTAIVTADERIRVTSDELGFATAELGEAATEALRVGLESVREHLTEAFRLHQLNHDSIPDTAEELRTRNARIIQLCEWAEQVLDERTRALQPQVARVREAPEILQRVRDDAARLRSRLPEARSTLERLATRYSTEALQRVRMTADDAEQLLDFALRSADLSERRRAAGSPEDANLALETATETVRRAASILDGLDGFEVRAFRSESTLAEVVEDSVSDIAAARGEQRTPAVDAAVAQLEALLAELRSPAGHGSTSGGDHADRAEASALRDPFADLARLSAANSALDAARQRAARPVIPIEHVRHDIATADHAIGIAASLIDGHRGWIGADARTRLAEARRIRAEISGLRTDEDTRAHAQQLARRASALGDDALRLAQRDIDTARPDNDDWGRGPGPSGYGRGGTGMEVLGPVIGGVILGGVLGNIFD